MNKKLLIVRHAKSDWGAPDLPDFLRPLNDRGTHDAPKMGKRLFNKDIKPELFVSSSATRAITTAEMVAQELGYNKSKIVQNRDIYEASCNQLLKIVNEFDNDYNFIALFGHNNGVTDLVVHLTDADIYNISTCGMVLIDFPFDKWEILGKASGEVVFYDQPKTPEKENNESTS